MVLFSAKKFPKSAIDAIREALVNSFCHRNYRIPQNNEVAIFKNRIEIYNPGTFPTGFTPQDFIEGSEHSIKRNPQLAQILYYSKDVETFGTGLQRISRACDDVGVKVEFKMSKIGFTVIFYRRVETDEMMINGDIMAINADGTAINGDKIIDYLRTHGMK